MLAQSHKTGPVGEILVGETLKKRIYPVFFLTVLDWLNDITPKSDGVAPNSWKDFWKIKISVFFRKISHFGLIIMQTSLVTLFM